MSHWTELASLLEHRTRHELSVCGECYILHVHEEQIASAGMHLGRERQSK